MTPRQYARKCERQWEKTLRTHVPPLPPTGVFLNIDRAIDDWYEDAPMFGLREPGDFPYPALVRRKGAKS